MHHFVVFVYLPKRRFKTTTFQRKHGLKLPHACVPRKYYYEKKNLIRIYKMSIYSSVEGFKFYLVIEGARILEAVIYMVLCSCGENHFYCITLYCLRSLGRVSPIVSHFKLVDLF